jgi:hypothetical protein
VAQSWVATWYPVVGSLVYAKLVVVHGSRTPTSHSIWTSKAEPTSPPSLGSYELCVK